MTGCGCDGAKCRLPAGDERHGRRRGYNLGCRCGECAAANLAHGRSHYAKNAEKKQAKERANREANRGKHLARHRLYRSTPEGRAVRRACDRRRKDRARQRSCPCTTTHGLLAVWALDSGLCAYCGAEGTDYEHVVPLARGGWGCVSNFRVACKSCNSRKGTRPLSVFLERLAASGISIRPGATNSGLPCPEAAYRMARLALPASPGSLSAT